MALVAFVIGKMIGWIPSGYGPRGGSAFSFVTLFFLASFLVLVPFGYIVENARLAVSLKFIGWIYFLYLLIAAAGTCYWAWNLFERYREYGAGDSDFWGYFMVTALPLAFYGTLSVPLSIVLALAKAARSGAESR